MARTTKTGLDYFPFDVDFFDDEKLQFLSAKFGIKGEIVAIKLLCRIYRNGFYLKWGKEESILFAKRAGEGITYNLINDIIEELTERNFFNKEIYETEGVLTSRGIQIRYNEASRRRKIKMSTLIPKGCNILLINDDINPINDSISPLNADINKQKRREERKGEEREKKGNEFPPRTFIQKYFEEIKQPAAEANKFYDYYSSRNWKIDGEVVTDFKVLVPNWFNRAPEFSTPKIKKNEPAFSSTLGQKPQEYKQVIQKADEEIEKHGKFKGFGKYENVKPDPENEDYEKLPI